MPFARLSRVVFSVGDAAPLGPLAVFTLAIVSGLTLFAGNAKAADTLYVASYNTRTIGEYDTTSGNAINASFLNWVDGLSGPVSLAIHGDSLFVGNLSTGAIGKYDATSGAQINGSGGYGTSFITGVSGPYGIAVSAVPEPSTCASLLAGLACGGYSMFRRRMRA